jgi:hypothetical protein
MAPRPPTGRAVTRARNVCKTNLDCWDGVGLSARSSRRAGRLRRHPVAIGWARGRRSFTRPLPPAPHQRLGMLLQRLGQEANRLGGGGQLAQGALQIALQR